MVQINLIEKVNQYTQYLRVKPFDTTTLEGRSKERYRRVALTTLAAIVAKIVTVMTSLVSVPLTLHYLGNERYGLWMTISSTIAFLGFADLGMGNGLLNAIAEANGNDDTESVQMFVSSAFFLLLGIAILILVSFVVIYPFVPWSRVYNVTSHLALNEAGPATAVLIISFVINMPLYIVRQVQMGYQDGFASYLWIIVGALLGLVGVLLAVFLKAGLPWLVFAMSGGPILAIALNWIPVFGFSQRQIAPNLKAFNWAASRKLVGTGSLFLILQLLALLGNTSDNLVIAQILGPSTVAGYAVTQKLFSITLVAQYFLIPLWPAFGEAMARDDRAWARRTLNRSLILSLGTGALMGLPLLFFGKQIILVWAGPDVVPSTLLLWGFTLWALVNSYIGSISTFLNSGVLVGKQIPFFALATLSALTLKIIGARYLQTEGVIWGTVLCFSLFYIIPATKLAYGALKTQTAAN